MGSAEAAQEIFEYARRGLLSNLESVIHMSHPDSYVAYDGSTALLMASKNGHFSVCELLLKFGADVSMRTDDGSTVLLLAASSGSEDLVRLLLNYRSVDINEPNEDGFRPLDIAKHYNYGGVIDLLSQNGAVESGIDTSGNGELEVGPSEKWGYGVFDQ
jgi:ankyrin repeat protein